MGQYEIIDFLRDKRLCEDNSFFSIHEICKGLNGGSPHYHNVRKSLHSLIRMDVIECKNTGDIFEWVRTFRLKDKYVKVMEEEV